MTQNTYTRIGVRILCIPLVFFLVFAIGEVASGDISGLSHVPQALLIGAFIFLASRKPRIAGIILTAVSVVLGVWYAVRAPFELQTIAFVELLLFVPLCVSGVLFLLSSGKK